MLGLEEDVYRDRWEACPPGDPVVAPPPTEGARRLPRMESDCWEYVTDNMLDTAHGKVRSQSLAVQLQSVTIDEGHMPEGKD